MESANNTETRHQGQRLFLPGKTDASLKNSAPKGAPVLIAPRRYRSGRPQGRSIRDLTQGEQKCEPVGVQPNGGFLKHDT